MEFLDSTAAGTNIDILKVYIMREVERNDQTEDDGSYIRIEAGKSLKGTYYKADGTEMNFVTVLKGAMSGIIGAAGVTLASATALLAF